MKSLLLTLLLIAGATSAQAQCHCVRLRLAMDDTRAYRYRYYVPGKRDTTSVEWLSPAVQVHRRSGPGVRFPESYGTEDPHTGRDTIRHDDRPYLLVPLAALHQHAYDASKVQVEVLDVATRRTMVLQFQGWGFDDQYDLLFDFAPGRRYRIDLRALSPTWSASQALAGFDVTPVAGTGLIQWLKLRRK
jgi:hypothetical protein